MKREPFRKLKLLCIECYNGGAFGSCFLAFSDSDCRKTCQIYDVFAKNFPGGFAPLTPTGALPLDPAGGCAPRPLPQLPRRRKRRLGRACRPSVRLAPSLFYIFLHPCCGEKRGSERFRGHSIKGEASVEERFLGSLLVNI